MKFSLVIANVLLASMAWSSFGAAPVLVAPSDKLIASFAKIKMAQIIAISQKRQIPVPPEFNELMAAAERADWPQVSNVYERVRLRSAWWAGSKPDTKISNELWHPFHETYFAFRLLRELGADNAERYVDDVLSNIPAGGVFFAGTDPGRFLCTLFRDVRGKPDITIITQNALAESTYVNYLHDVICSENSICIPQSSEACRAYRQFIEDSNAGHMPDGVKIENGRICCSNNVAGMMGINGILAKLIFDQNKDKHPFYVEESYVIPWMYPYLSPAGVIMKLNQEPLPAPQQDPKLWQNIIKQDFVFGGQFFTNYYARTAIQQNIYAKDTYCKMRCAMAGIYEFRGMVNAAEAAYQQAITFSPANPEASFRLSNLYLRLNQPDKSIQTLRTLSHALPDNQLVREALQQYEAIQAEKK